MVLKLFYGFKIFPRVQQLCHYNQFSWKATGASSIEPDKTPTVSKRSCLFYSQLFLSLYYLNNANGGVSWPGNYKILPFFAIFKQVFAPVLKIIGDKLNILRFRKVAKTKQKNDLSSQMTLPTFFESKKLRFKRFFWKVIKDQAFFFKTESDLSTSGSIIIIAFHENWL